MKPEILTNVQKAEFAVIFYFSSYWSVLDVIYVYEVDSIEAAQNIPSFQYQGSMGSKEFSWPFCRSLCIRKGQSERSLYKTETRDVFF